LVFAWGVVACSTTGDARAPAFRTTSETARPVPVAVVSAAPASTPGAAPSPPVAPAPPANPKPRSPYAYANDDPADDLVVAPPEPRADCHDALTKAGIKFADANIPVHHEGKKGKPQLTCGAEQVVVFRGGPAGIAFEPTPVVTCSMALALARFQTVVQEEATRTFGERVVRITQLGTYSCREMAAYRGWVSEHSYANAIDVETFVLKSGKRVSVLQGFERGDTTRTRAGAFLRTVSRRAYDEELFSNVLTPFFDELHRNHFHLDLARYRNDGTRPMEEETP
jgi:hypothetical protein